MVHYWKVVAVAECKTIIMNSVMILHSAEGLIPNLGIYLDGDRGVPSNFSLAVLTTTYINLVTHRTKQPYLLVGHLNRY